ncbi:MAG: hypothetical protein UR39_C0002G0049 [Candidatus Woesebacteria bacterium GW2011_GWA1_33_30]|uniref:Uncharacterized protein n=1 Tax=Candidatus Woesebacteria bacterium GW2011_GWA2_33_28 TaxID=1618561 RepID=A0A0G0A9D4_9BACT|nr:MAG: hypothetical protein UR38_C0002G0049 [Candidatus Woesebacteria bacterium GW2011_GWA2_33_28]KKP48759.1 MAG: hypothetical protein UR39_C0002G0049 [Candidatus Woesebacteria bacterium GW2011_GWA1_33_30]KKP50032.1 MAG: hypothetical protein UR40_C0002G0049 [Microgenomates group bacterium GW2011_GWC1_33_32]KKP51803.1 MAG: hypothetical protein UR44_C0006G0049 [Candidatus Woesebacteria bacterium GW2011_GWB1_33_38]KKP58583.1 MAG: hypothetical protein UR48_C0003G0010 [Microgenomates group bacteriu
MTENKTTNLYRGAKRTREELINFLMQLGRLGQLQGKSTEWRNLEDYIVANNEPADWLADEEIEIDRLLKEDL